MKFIIIIKEFVKTHLIMSISIGVVIVGGAVTPIILNNLGEDEVKYDDKRREDNEENKVTCEEGFILKDGVCVEIKGEENPEIPDNPLNNDKKEEVENKGNTSNSKPVSEPNKNETNNNNNNGNSGSNNEEVGGYGDSWCDENPNDKECIYQKWSDRVTLSNIDDAWRTFSISFDGKEVYTRNSVDLQKCYDDYTCYGRPSKVYLYTYNKSYISSLDKQYREFLSTEFYYKQSNWEDDLRFYDSIIKKANELITLQQGYIANYEKDLLEIPDSEQIKNTIAEAKEDLRKYREDLDRMLKEKEKLQEFINLMKK